MEKTTNLEKTFFVVVIVLVLICPLRFMQFSIVSFTQTGKISGTIGDITAPIIGLFSVLLLYYTLVEQRKANKISQHEANFSIIFSEIEKFEKAILEYTFRDTLGRYSKGSEAIGKFYTHYGEIFADVKDRDFDILNSFDLLLCKFLRLFRFLDNLKTSDEQKRLLEKELQRVFKINFSIRGDKISNRWSNNINVFGQDSISRKKLAEIQQHAQDIANKINQFSKHN